LPRTDLGQKRPKLPWRPAAKSTTEQGVKFVPLPDIPSMTAGTIPLSEDRDMARFVIGWKSE
jgi:hypothetical protein